MASAAYIKAIEGFDIYSAGALNVTNYPWYVQDATRTGVVTANAGAFPSANGLVFTGSTTPSVLGLEYQFPSTALLGRALSTAGYKSLWGIGFWFDATRTVNGTNMLLGLGNSVTPAQVYQFFGYTQSTGGGLQLLFPTNINSPTTTPLTYPILNSAQYWVDIRFSIYATGVWLASYWVNDTLVGEQAITWSTDALTTTVPVNRLKFYASSNIDYTIDDLVIRTASSADGDWVSAGANPVIADINQLTASRIYPYTANANGTTNEWASSDGTTANYLAATDATGAKYVVSDTVGQTDLYKFVPPVGATPTDVKAVAYRGASAKFTSVQPVKRVASTVSNMQRTSAASARVISIAENDGTSAWTASSIIAAEFGQKSV